MQKFPERDDRHINQEQLDKKEQQRVLDELQEKIQAPPDAEIAAEQFAAEFPGHLREGSHRADKRTERFLGQQCHPQEGKEKHQRSRVNRIKVPGEQPGFEAYQRTDRQEALDSRRTSIISHPTHGFEMTDKQPELYAEKEAPAEEKPLDRQSPVTWFFPIGYQVHNATRIHRKAQ